MFLVVLLPVFLVALSVLHAIAILRARVFLIVRIAVVRIEFLILFIVLVAMAHGRLAPFAETGKERYATSDVPNLFSF
jgi:hypothetical protein